MDKKAVIIKLNNAASTELLINKPQMIGIYGASGVGKSQFLRNLAGLDRDLLKNLTIFSQNWQSDQHFTPCHKRDIAMVFQEMGLFEHLTAIDNLTFAMKQSNLSLDDAFTQDIIQLCEIEVLLAKNVKQLSGGERQRIAIARALLLQSNCLLLDEAMSALDMRLTHKILRYISQMQKEKQLLVFYISHQAIELGQHCDQILWMQNKHSFERYTKQDFTQHIGEKDDAHANLLSLKIDAFDQKYKLLSLSFEDGQQIFIPMSKAPNIVDSDDYWVEIDSHNISLSNQDPSQHSSMLNHLNANIESFKQHENDAFIDVMLNISGQKMRAQITQKSKSHLALTVGQNIWASIKSATLKS